MGLNLAHLTITQKLLGLGVFAVVVWSLTYFAIFGRTRRVLVTARVGLIVFLVAVAAGAFVVYLLARSLDNFPPM